MPSNIDFWTDERIKHLVVLWDDLTLSAAMIAAEMGNTRNAILGKAHRLGLKSRANPLFQTNDAEQVIKPRKEVQPRRPNSETWLPTRHGVRRVVKSKNSEHCAKALGLGFSRTSPEYRSQLGLSAQMSSNQLRAMLAEAVRNTAAIQISEAS